MDQRGGSPRLPLPDPGSVDAGASPRRRQPRQRSRGTPILGDVERHATIQRVTQATSASPSTPAVASLRELANRLGRARSRRRRGRGCACERPSTPGPAPPPAGASRHGGDVGAALLQREPLDNSGRNTTRRSCYRQRIEARGAVRGNLRDRGWEVDARPDEAGSVLLPPSRRWRSTLRGARLRRPAWFRGCYLISHEEASNDPTQERSCPRSAASPPSSALAALREWLRAGRCAAEHPD